MNGVIEALHIYDERNSPTLSHTYTSRPLSASHLLPLFLDHTEPRPNVIYLPNTSPPTLVFSLRHGSLLFLLTTSSEIEPLLVLEFLHRVVDVLEDFLGSPLLAHKIEASYDVVAQLLTEMCDAGTVATTEPNALRDMVEVEGFMGKLLGNLNLPAKAAGFAANLANAAGAASSATGGAASGAAASSSSSSFSPHQAFPALPWRRANVRHTSNELYADVVETLSVTLAPSGRPLAAFANGTIAFTSKVSGVPDIVLTLTGPSGRHNLADMLDLPVFHPCVRLARWRERPGELSFIPPDGRFILAGYEVDLLPPLDDAKAAYGGGPNKLRLPVSIGIKTGLGPVGAEFEVRVTLNRIFGPNTGSAPSGRGGAGAGAGPLGGSHPGTAASPVLQDLTITVPLPPDVRNLSDVRPSKGDASYNPGDSSLEWHIRTKDLGVAAGSLRCTVVGPLGADEDGEDTANLDPSGLGFGASYSYDEPYQQQVSATAPGPSSAKKKTRASAERLTRGDGGDGDDDNNNNSDSRDDKKTAQNRTLMPSAATVSFAVKGWLASGVRVESIVLDPRRSRGLGEAVKPYKGVKYLTISKSGVEIRC